MKISIRQLRSIFILFLVVAITAFGPAFTVAEFRNLRYDLSFKEYSDSNGRLTFEYPNYLNIQSESNGSELNDTKLYLYLVSYYGENASEYQDLSSVAQSSIDLDVSYMTVQLKTDRQRFKYLYEGVYKTEFFESQLDRLQKLAINGIDNVPEISNFGVERFFLDDNPGALIYYSKQSFLGKSTPQATILVVTDTHELLMHISFWEHASNDWREITDEIIKTIRVQE